MRYGWTELAIVSILDASRRRFRASGRDIDGCPCRATILAGFSAIGRPASSGHAVPPPHPGRHVARPGSVPARPGPAGTAPRTSKPSNGTADADRGARRVAVHGPPRWPPHRPDVVLVGRRGDAGLLQAGCGQGAQPAREPAADGRAGPSRIRLLGRADRGRGLLEPGAAEIPDVLCSSPGTPRCWPTARPRDLPRHLANSGHPHRPDPLPLRGRVPCTRP